ncbi:LuxR C-terminal-related transcriptional regulator [Crystallibacter degradans]|uniref:LuxR C-terminal-related transcriptional regulator n=1 Tax=Crystallibacter degradans TaxID=2726743 RepID=UPI0014753777|nr:helix-turn-helix transcriptional regulator [Arthrobacter sp. SF27]
MLTRRERQVLTFLAEGSDVPATDRKLNITQNTCRGYVKSILAKLGAHSQLQAVASARRLHLLA